MRKWKRNWMIKRMVLGFAVVALVVPAVAQARVDSGIGMPNPANQVTGDTFVPFVTDFPRYEWTSNVSSVNTATPIGLPNAGLNDYLKARDGIEVARLQPRNEVRSGDLIENVRLAPRSVAIIAQHDYIVGSSRAALERQRMRGAPLDIHFFENATHAFEDAHAEDPRVRYNPGATAREHALLREMIAEL